MCHYGALFGEAFNVVGLAGEEGFGYEEGEVGVVVTGFFEHVVEGTLHFLPDGVSVGFDDHATTHGGLLGEVSFHDEVVIPLGVVLAARGKFFCHG